MGEMSTTKTQTIAEFNLLTLVPCAAQQHIQCFYRPGTLTEGDGSVPLTSLY